MKEFTTAATRVAEEGEELDSVYTLEFAVDGETLHARRPKDGQLAVLMTAASRHMPDNMRIATLIDFFVNVLDIESHHYVVGRLLDGDDEFGLEEVQDIMEWMVEEWTGRPTQPPSVSTQSRRTGGQKSTRRTPAST